MIITTKPGVLCFKHEADVEYMEVPAIDVLTKIDEEFPELIRDLIKFREDTK